MGKKFILSFHDISVYNFDKVAPLLTEIQKVSGGPFALMVVPGLGKVDEERCDAFLKQLQDWKAAGFELGLHGYNHKATLEVSKRSYLGLVALKMTNDEAEFAGLNTKDSRELLTKALAAWEKLKVGLPAVFVPPAWYSNSHLPKQVLWKGFVYEGRMKIEKPGNKSFISAPISIAGIPDFTVKAALLYGKASLEMPVGTPRIVMHPTDFPKYKKELMDLIRLAKKTRTRVRYTDL